MATNDLNLWQDFLQIDSEADPVIDSPSYKIPQTQGPTPQQGSLEDLHLAEMVRQFSYPKRYGARIPVKSKWNIELLSSLLQDYSDFEMVEWLRFGWPVRKCLHKQTQQRTVKITSAEEFPQAFDIYQERIGERTHDGTFSRKSI